MIALYFASLSKKWRPIKRGTKERPLVEPNGEVVHMAVDKNQVRYIDSDTVGNLAQCDITESVLAKAILSRST